MEKLLFCRIGWMNYYQGNLEEDPISGGGSYVDSYGYGHELYNFLPDEEGNLYGFVEVGGEMAIWRLGAKFDESSVTGVKVIWCASSSYSLYIVGWYKNATAFRTTQACPRHLMGRRLLPRSDDAWTFRFVAKEQDALLLPTNERNFEIPRATTSSGGFGRRNIWYADSDENEPFRQEVLSYVSSKEAEISKDRTHKKLGRYHPDIEKRYRIEKTAMKAVETYYRDRGWVIQDVAALNRGWDIEAKKDDSILRIEVKGLSGGTIVTDMTPREYEQMKLFSSDGSYRLCVLVNALESRSYLYHFTYNLVSKELIGENQEMRLQIEERVGARVKEASF